MSEADVSHVISTLMERATRGSLKCVGCSSPLDISGLRMYLHRWGYHDPKTGERYWVYIICRKCGYQNAAWKLLGALHPPIA
jgi:C4-type Zn-finger protein